MLIIGPILQFVAAVAGSATLKSALSFASTFLSFTHGVFRSLEKPVPRNQELSVRTRLEPGAPIPVVYGRARVGSIVANWFTAPLGALITDPLLYMACVLAHGSRDGEGIAEIEEIWFDGRRGVVNPAAGEASAQFSPPYAARNSAFEVFLGNSGQNVANTPIVTSGTAPCSEEISGWAAECATAKGEGMAILSLLLLNASEQQDGDKFPFNGPPQVSAIVKGNFVEDPRSEVSGIGITFDDSPATIVRASGDWAADGYAAGDRIDITGSSSNNRKFSIESVDSATQITVSPAPMAEAQSSTEVIKRWAPPDNVGDNPALCIRDYLLSNVYGFGFEGLGLLDEQSFKDMADFCDEPEDDGQGHSVPRRFTCNGFLDTGRPTGENLRDLLTSCRGELSWEQGKLKLYIRRATAPASTVTLDKNKIIGGWNFRKAGIEDRWNLVKALWIDPLDDSSNSFKQRETQWPPIGATNNFLTADNGFLAQLDLHLPFTNDQFIAQAIAQVVLFESRQDIRVTVRCTEDALQLSVGDRAKITHATPGWTEKEFWVEGLQLLPDTSVVVNLREYDPAAYQLGTLSDKDSIPDTSLGSITNVPAIPVPVLVTSGTRLDRIKIDWPSPNYNLTDFYEVQAKCDSCGEPYRIVARVRPGGSNLREAFAHGVRNGQTWKARVRIVNTAGNAGPWTESAGHVVQIHDVPAVTLSLAAVANGVEIAVSDFDADGDGINAARVELFVRENSAASGPDPFETPAYHVNTFLLGEGAFLEPAAENRYIRCFAVPYNAFGDRGVVTPVSEQQSGATGAGPDGPPTGLTLENEGDPGVTTNPEQIDISWTDGDASGAVTRMYLDGVQIREVALGASPESITGLESDTEYVVGFRHLENGIFDPVETDPAVAITVRTLRGTLGTPQNLAAQTFDNPARVKLTWQMGTDGEEASYVIERSPQGAGTWSQIGTAGVGVLEFTHEDNANENTAFDFRVKARRTNWNDSAFTSAVTGTYGNFVAGGFARPIVDISNPGGFSPSSGTDLWAMVDEATADDDTTYVKRSASNTTGPQFEVKLSDLGDDFNSELGIVVRVRIRLTTAAAEANDVTYRFDLKQGISTIAFTDPRIEIGTRTTYVTDTLTLTAQQRAAITDPANLRVQVSVTWTTPAGTREVRITQLEMENA